jgi:hypothetical protein
MKVRWSILWLVLFICSLSAWAQTRSAQAVKPAPQIKFAEEEYDFGTAEEGALLKHVFKFKNTGNDTLRIKQVKAG